MADVNRLYTRLVIEGGPHGECGVAAESEWSVWCAEPIAYGFTLNDLDRPGHGFACAGHALQLRIAGLVASMWTCTPSMV